MHRDNWDDLRFVLAVAETGSVSAAARQLQVNHATVLRRVAAFEDRHGGPIFQRTALGYQVPPDRLRVIEAAREVATAIGAVSRVIKGANAQPSGILRITSTDTFCQAILPRIIAQIMVVSPDLRIELSSSNEHLDLGRLHADISVRPGLKLADDLRGEWAGELAFDVFGVSSAADKWLGLRGALARSRPASWLAENIASENIESGADSFQVLREMAAAGLGLAILPLCLGAHDPRLRHVPDLMPQMSVPIWVASHIDLADVPRLRSVRALLVRHLVSDPTLN